MDGKNEDEIHEGRLIIDNIDQDDDVIGAVLNLVDVADDDLQRISSHSSTYSISPRSLPVGDSNENSPDNVPVGSTDEDLVNSPVLTVACGYLTAKLHMDRFYCPGIHQLCVEYNGQFLTPKQFTIVAAKDKQKDWKGAIKINRQPVRILFERNLLDFYKHSEYCSGRCVSKSYKPITDISMTNSTTEVIQNGGTFMDTAAIMGRAAAELAVFANGFSIKTEMDDDEDEGSQRRRGSVGNSETTSGSSGFRITTPMDFNTVQGSSNMMYSEPVLYWNCVSQLGLFHELTQEIEQHVQVLKTSFGIPELRTKAARKLSELVRILDIGDKIQQKLIAKRTYANAQCALLASELNELRKIAENQEKKQREVKRKSELLDHLIGNLQEQRRKQRRGSSVSTSAVAPTITVPTSPNQPCQNLD